MLNLFQDKLVFYSKSVVVLMGSEGKGSQELISHCRARRDSLCCLLFLLLG